MRKGFTPPNIQKKPMEVPGLIPDLSRLSQVKPYESNDTNRNASWMVCRPIDQQLAFVWYASTHREPDDVGESVPPVSVGSLPIISKKDVKTVAWTHQRHSIQQ